MNKFAFVVNPAGVDNAWSFPFSRLLPGRLLEGLLRYAPPVKSAEFKNIESSLGKTEGLLISIPLTKRQINRLPHRVLAKKISRAVEMARKTGAEIIGLGEFAPLLGEEVTENIGIAAVSGLRYSLSSSLQTALDAAVLMGHDLRKAHVVVLDAAGQVGSICALLLAGWVKNMTLVDKEKKRITDLAGKILFDSGLSVKISHDYKRAVGTAHIVVSPRGQIIDSDLLPGAVICNVARSSSAGGETAVVREDVLTIEGALIKVPGAENINLFPGLPPGIICPSMAETIILAIEGRRENYVPISRVTVSQIREMAMLAKKHGFRISGARGVKSPLTQADIDKVRDNARKKGFREHLADCPLKYPCCNNSKMP